MTTKDSPSSRARSGWLPELPVAAGAGAGGPFGKSDFTASEEIEIRRLALICASLHHGLSNLSSKAVPPKTETVLITARRFERYLLDGTVEVP